MNPQNPNSPSHLVAPIASHPLLRRVPVLFALAVLYFIALHPHAEFDSRLLIAGQLFPEKFTDWFPLCQHITCQVFYWLGAKSDYAICRAWSGLSFISFIGIGVLLYRTASRQLSCRAGLLALLIVFSGTMFYYGASSYNEIPAAFLIVAYTASLVLDAPLPLIVILFVLASLTREVVFPILMLLWIVRFQGRPGSKILREIPAILVSAVISFALASYFNYTRYHSIWNLEYLKPFRIVHWPQQGLFFLAQFFSPSGGLLFFWPLFLLLVLVAIRHLNRRVAIPLIALLIVMTGLSRWHTPFGWICWGPRLIIPWVPSITLLLVIDKTICDRLSSILTRWLLPATILISLAILPQIIAIDSMPFMYSEFDSLQIPPESPQFLPAQNPLMWKSTPMIWIALKHFGTPAHIILAILCVPAVYCLLRLIRQNDATITT